MAQTKGKRLVIVDFYDVGHHPIYLNGFERAALPDFEDVLVVSPSNKGLKSASHRTCIKSGGILRRIPGNRWVFEVIRGWWVSKVARQFAADEVFFACIYKDDFRLFRLWRKFFRGLRIGGLVLNVSWKDGGEWQYEVRPGSLGHGLDYILTLDELAAEELNETLDSKVIWLPELGEAPCAESSAICDRIKRAAGYRKIVTIAGFLHGEKGIFEFSRLVKGLDPEEYFFVMIGQMSFDRLMDDEIESVVDFLENYENVFTHLTRIRDDGAFNRILAESSVIFAAYRDFPHSSHSMIKAALLGRPVIVSKGFLCERLVNKYSLGRAINLLSPLEAAEAVAELSEWKDSGQMNGEIQAVFSFEEFEKRFLSCFES